MKLNCRQEQKARCCSVRDISIAFVPNLEEERVAKADRRVRRTREALHKALMSLALEKEYDAITVQEVLDRADIGRSTFYMHFQSKV